MFRAIKIVFFISGMLRKKTNFRKPFEIKLIFFSVRDVIN